jgi:YNFM family putative membrane transporter
MVGASILLVIPTLLCALAPNFVVLLLARTAQGLLMPGLTSVAVVYIAELFPEAQRGRAMGVYVGGQVLGGLLARGVSSALTAWIDWRGALISFAAFTALGALAIARYLPQSPGTMRAERVSLAAGLRLHLGNRRLLGLCAIGLSMFFAFVGVFTYLPYYLTGAPWHFPVGAMGLVYLVWITGLCSPLAGSLAARYTARRVILCSLTCSCLGIALLSVQLLPVLVLGLLMLTLGQFTAMPGVNLLVSEAGSSARGAAYALYLCCYYLGGSAGAVLPGILFTHLGWPGVLACCGASAVVALIAAQRARIG